MRKVTVVYYENGINTLTQDSVTVNQAIKRYRTQKSANAHIFPLPLTLGMFGKYKVVHTPGAIVLYRISQNFFEWEAIAKIEGKQVTSATDFARDYDVISMVAKVFATED